MTAIVFEDFIKTYRKKSFSAITAERIMKLIVVIFGIICTGLVFVVEKTSTHVLQVNNMLLFTFFKSYCNNFVC